MSRVENQLRALNRKLGLGEYGEKANKRYVHTINILLQEGLDNESDWTIGEIGPALLLSYLHGNYDNLDCVSIQTPNETEWKNKFSAAGIEVFEWDLNKNLTRAGLNQFDIILFPEVLEHLNRWPEFVLSDINSLLKPGGKLLISTPNLFRIKNRIKLACGITIFNPFHYTPTGEHHVREFSAGEVKKFLDMAGFETNLIELRCMKSGLLGSFVCFLSRFFPQLFAELIFVVASKRSPS